MIEQWLQDRVEFYEAIVTNCSKRLREDLSSSERGETTVDLNAAGGALRALAEVRRYLRERNYTAVPKEVVDKYYGA